MFSTILIGLGANLPGAGRAPLETCRWAAARLDGLCGCRLLGLSRWYETAPVPASDQPWFVNGVAHLSGAVDPHRLLLALHELEAEAGRMRGAVNAPRVLDLDLIGMDAVMLDGPVVLPHPRAADRAFVLAPACDVAPDWRHPGLRQSARELLAALPNNGLRSLA